MSTSSRQEAMEGEPVRRHVSDAVLRYDKPVYGMFIANRIDSNTAETFRIGIWYTRDDERLELHIIPFTLMQFSMFFKAFFSKGNVTPQAVIDLMIQCEQIRRDYEAPQWKARIAETVSTLAQ